MQKRSSWVGDDVAILKNGLLLSTDSFIEGVHFTPSNFSYLDIGYKALASALSDIAADGGKPEYYMVNLGLRKDSNLSVANSIFEGFSILEDKYSVELIGGDTFRSPILVLCLTVIGYSDKPVNRAGALPDDGIYLTGNLGGASCGLYALQNGIDSEIKIYHLRPEIRIDEGLYLNGIYNITSMIDLSDGLLIDANRIAKKSGVRMDIARKKIPVPEDCIEFCHKYDLDLEEIIITSGEEFELLFTSSDNIELDYVSRIGKVSEGYGVYLDGKFEEPRGYHHFNS